MTNYVLDTNIVSFVLSNRPPQARRRFDQLSVPGNTFFGCPVVWYELRRGLLAKDAYRQMGRLQALFALFTWKDYTLDDWALAADWWAQRKAVGRPISDADLLIAVFARNREAVLVTDNEKDFDGLTVTLENWLKN